MRVPSSPNQSAITSTPWEAEAVVEESGPVEDANAENLYLMGMYLYHSIFPKDVNIISLPLSLITVYFPFCSRNGAVWRSITKVGAGSDYSASHPLDLQQQQPRPAGGNVWRFSRGNYETVIIRTYCLIHLYKYSLVICGAVVVVLLVC